MEPLAALVVLLGVVLLIVWVVDRIASDHPTDCTHDCDQGRRCTCELSGSASSNLHRP